MNNPPMTLGLFRQLTSFLPDNTPLVIANFDSEPHASPQYWGLPVAGTQIQYMGQVGAWWHNQRDPAYFTDVPVVQVVFINPMFPNPSDNG